jgi:cytochrome oxidase Cu insertion factor (SCO1/SenC/PrrC family)
MIANEVHRTVEPKKRSMWPLYAILLMALAPVVAAVLAYFMPQLGLRPEGHTNYGRILEPQRPAPGAEALPLTTLEGKPFDLASLRGQWVLLTADTAACPESCVRKLFILRNSHASQGKNVDRVSRVWFVTDNEEIPQQVLDAYVGTHMVRADPNALAGFLSADRQGAEAQEALRQHMWIIDPLGNLMMEFPPNADPIEVRDDIVKLLKRSRIG